jgi:hypothetical protein
MRLSETTTEDTEMHGKGGFAAQASVPCGWHRFQSTIQLQRLQFFRVFRTTIRRNLSFLRRISGRNLSELVDIGLSSSK